MTGFEISDTLELGTAVSSGQEMEDSDSFMDEREAMIQFSEKTGCW